jgi:hypothetical protein
MDGMAMARTTGKMALTLLIFTLHGLRRLLLCLLLGFELLFVFRSLFDVLSGGIEKMVGWWWHLQMEASISGRVFASFHLGKFLWDQFLVLAVMGVLWFFERRSRRRWSRSVTLA